MTHKSCESYVLKSYGRLLQLNLVNKGHSKEEYDIFLPRQIESAIKPHQIGGVR